MRKCGDRRSLQRGSSSDNVDARQRGPNLQSGGSLRTSAQPPAWQLIRQRGCSTTWVQPSEWRLPESVGTALRVTDHPEQEKCSLDSVTLIALIVQAISLTSFSISEKSIYWGSPRITINNISPLFIEKSLVPYSKSIRLKALYF